MGAWYHASVKTVSRGKGRSATAAVAYRTASKIIDERTGETHDYTRKRGVLGAFIIAPEHAPDWTRDRAKLWNAAEQREKHPRAVTARELELALPASLPPAEREAVARAMATEIMDRYGVAVDVALHAPHRDGDQRNFHAHMLFTTRRIGPSGFTEKTRELDDNFKKDKDGLTRGAREVLHLRERAAAITNRHLERFGSIERVDHRSLDVRGIDREPQHHRGPASSEMERRGAPSRIGNDNRAIQSRNRQQKARRDSAEVIDLELAREKRRAAEFEQQQAQQAVQRKGLQDMADNRPWTKRQRSRKAEPEQPQPTALQKRQEAELADFLKRKAATDKRLAEEKEAAVKRVAQREADYRADRLAQVREEHRTNKRGFARYRETMQGWFANVRAELAKVSSTVLSKDGRTGWLKERGNQAAREVSEPTTRDRQRIEKTVIEGSKARERAAAREAEQQHSTRKAELEAAQTRGKEALVRRQKAERDMAARRQAAPKRQMNRPDATAGIQTNQAKQPEKAKPMPYETAPDGQKQYVDPTAPRPTPERQPERPRDPGPSYEAQKAAQSLPAPNREGLDASPPRPKASDLANDPKALRAAWKQEAKERNDQEKVRQPIREKYMERDR